MRMNHHRFPGILSILCVFTLLFSCTLPFLTAVAEETQSVTLIVQLAPSGAIKKTGRPVSQNNANMQSVRSILSAQTSLQKKISRIDPHARVGYSYTRALNGFSLKARTADIEKIRALDGVKAVYISQDHMREEPVEIPASDIGVENSSVMTQVDLLQKQGYCGEGMLIAIVDTEFDLGSAFLTNEPADTSLLRYGSPAQLQSVMDETEFNANVSALRAWKNTKVPFAWNYDCSSADTYNAEPEVIHGSHVAGIAAGKNGVFFDGTSFNGVAPEAQLLCMACPTLSTESTLAAIDDAIKLGADALNMSWGVNYAENDLYDDIFETAAESGMMLYCAAGNFSRSLLSPETIDYGSTGTPASSETCVSVASALNTYYLGDGCEIVAAEGKVCDGVDQNPNSPFVFEEETNFIYCGEYNEENRDIEGFIAVFDHGDMTFAERVSLAYDSGAIGVLFLLNEEEFMYYGHQIADESIIEELPTVVLDSCYADIFRSDSSLTSHSSVEVFSSAYDVISDFSAWGVGKDLLLEPDISTPGEMIWSSVPVEESDKGYIYYSGTSMASPHMTGASVLLKQYLLANEAGFAEQNAEEQVAEINERMMSAAKIIDEIHEDTDPKTDTVLPYSPRLQGSGLLQLDAAAKTPVLLEGDKGRSKISLGTIGGSFEVSFSAKNLSAADAVYDSVELILFTETVTEDEDFYYYKSIPVPCEIKDLPDSLTVAAGSEKKVSLTLTPDADTLKEIAELFTNGFFIDGFVCFADSNGTIPDISIPFTGFYGDWTAAPLFDGTYWDDDAFLGFTRLTSEAMAPYDWEYYDSYLDINTPVLGENTDALSAAEAAENAEEISENPEDPEQPKEPDPPENDDPEMSADLSGNVFYVGYDDSKNYSSADYAAISPNFDGYFDTLMVDLFPLRTADVVSLRITNAEGTDISELLPEDQLAWRCISDEVETVTPYGEPFSIFRLNANVYRLISDIEFRPYDEDADYDELDLDDYYSMENTVLPDGEYTLTVTAKFTAESDKEETLVFPFRVDTVYPEVDFVSFREEDGVTYLDVTASDDSGLYSVMVNYSVLTLNDPVEETTKGCLDDLFGAQRNLVYPVPAQTETTCSFELSEFDPSSPANIYLQDYAGNIMMLSVLPYSVTSGETDELRWNKLSGTQMEFTLTGPEGSEPNAPVSVSIDNELFFWLTPDCITDTGFILPATFLRNAATGEHTLSVSDEFGCAMAKLTVYEETDSDDFIPGDANLDGKVNSTDARITLRSAAGLEPLKIDSKAFRQADANKDGKVRSNDARMILRASAHLEDPKSW